MLRNAQCSSWYACKVHDVSYERKDAITPDFLFFLSDSPPGRNVMVSQL